MKKCVGSMVLACLFLLLLPLPRTAAFKVNVGIYQNEPLIFTDDTGTAKGIFADMKYAINREFNQSARKNECHSKRAHRT